MIIWVGQIISIGILVIDISTFIFATATLLLVQIPETRLSAAVRKEKTSLWSESAYGFRYILERPSLLGLQMIFLTGNFFSGLAFAVFPAMILARTGNDELALGSVQSAGALGGLAGGLLMTAWGGPKRRVHGVLSGWAFCGVAGMVLMGVGRIPPFWIASAFLGELLVPILNGSNQAIWQAKVTPNVQGRVFSIRRLIAWFVQPIAMLASGPLVDSILEPSMRNGGSLAGSLGWLVGKGPGAGMALLFVFGGALATLTGLSGYAIPAIRAAEDTLPDHDKLPTEERAPADQPSPPIAAPWTPRQKTALVLAALVMAGLVIGLGWLQVMVMSTP